MKKFFSFSFNLWAFIYLITTVHAQTTITNRVFPEAGDSIIFTLDTTVAGSALPQTWELVLPHSQLPHL